MIEQGRGSCSGSMNKKKILEKYLALIEPQWHPFLEKIADTVHPLDPAPHRWSPQDESWFKLVNHLNGIAAAYVAWQGAGTLINEHGDIDDARVLELIQPCGLSETNQRLFLSVCQQLVRDLQKLQQDASEEAGTE